MIDPTCVAVRAVLLDPDGRPGAWRSHAGIARHVSACSACRDFIEAFAEGERAWLEEPAGALADGVIARTAGLEAVVRDLPALRDLDPGPGFAERVLAATARRRHAPGWRTRMAASWWALVRRPRFAWEAAYVATVCWVLVFGNPVGAIEWSASGIRTVAEERIGGRARELASDLESWRARLAPGAAPEEGLAAPTKESGSAAARVVRTASAELQSWTRWLQGLLAEAAGRLAGWVEWLSDQLNEPETEPAPPPARSGQ